MLKKKLGLRLGLEEVLYAYSFKRHKLSRYYLVVDAQPLHLVTNLPNTVRTSLKEMCWCSTLGVVPKTLC